MAGETAAERRQNELEERISRIEAIVERLAVSKLSDPRYPYWDFLIVHDIPEEARHQIEMIMSERSAILREHSAQGKEVPGAVRFEEIEGAFAGLLGTKRKQFTLDLLATMYHQGKWQELVDNLFSQLDLDILSYRIRR